MSGAFVQGAEMPFPRSRGRRDVLGSVGPQVIVVALAECPEASGDSLINL
jgi:hypothetical protein